MRSTAITGYKRAAMRLRGLLVQAGVEQKEIAEKCQVSRFTVRNVLLGISPNQDVRKAIAEAVGKPVWKLWPDEKCRI